MTRHFILLACAILFIQFGGIASGQQQTFDVIVYGATASGVCAAMAVSNEGLSVAIVERGFNVGGMVSGGLGWTDIGNPAVVGGLAETFFLDVGKVYGSSAPTYHFEPHVAEHVFVTWLNNSNIPVFFNNTIRSVQKTGTSIKSLHTEEQMFSAAVFIDASYEGDLMALSGVAYVWGREALAQYNESLAGRAGVRSEPNKDGGHQFSTPVDPYYANGSLLPLVYGGSPGQPGEGDKKVQAYNFRMCLSNQPSNQIAWSKPPSYDPARWELFRRYLANMTDPKMSNLMTVNMLPNGKTDINNNGAISTDFIGGSWDYPDSNWTVRETIFDSHVSYTQGFFWFLASDPAVPATLRKEMSQWGLCKDEFVNTEHWPHQLYVREARRMLGEYVFTQRDRFAPHNTKNDTIGLGSYNIDTHHAQRFAQKAGAVMSVVNEGDVELRSSVPFEIPYAHMLPKSSECNNLIVPVCTSASHIGYGCLRLEPQFMIMGQSAGVAAAMAIQTKTSPDTIDISRLQTRLAQLAQKLFV